MTKGDMKSGKMKGSMGKSGAGKKISGFGSKVGKGGMKNSMDSPAGPACKK